MSLSYKQVRYLWAIGYFKAGGSKGKVSAKVVSSKSAPKEHTTEESAMAYLNAHFEKGNSHGKDFKHTKESVAIDNYGGGNYEYINTHLRNPNQIKAETTLFPHFPTMAEPTVAETVKNLDAAFIKHGAPLKEDLLVHRGVSREFAAGLERDIQSGKVGVGSVMSDNAYLSTSLTAGGAIKSRTPIHFKITAPKGTQALRVDDAQQELLFHRDNKMTITKIEKQYDLTVIHATLHPKAGGN